MGEVAEGGRQGGHRRIRAGERAIVLDQAFQRFPGQVQPVKLGIAPLQPRDDAQGLGIVVKPLIGLHAGVQLVLPSMAEGRMA